MIAKLDNFSEITKLPNVKSRIGDDIFSLFSKFRLSQTLSRLCMEKQCGYSASELIQALCLFKVLGETISSMWYHKFYDLLQVGKNCFYRMLTRSSMDWRRLLAVMAVHFIGILRSRKVDFYKGTSCFILDDTTAEKTTKRGERVSRVFGHVISKCVLGYKVQILCVSDGTTTIPVDFSIHREKGGDGSWGLTAGELRKQFRKKREKESPSMERLMEADRSKLDVAVEMIRRAWKLRIRPGYVLAESWYLSEKLLRGIIDIGKGALHFLGMAKTEELKNSATKTATAALNGINSLLGGNKVSRLEKENAQRHREIEDLNDQIERLHTDMQKMKDSHAMELTRTNEQHQQEVSNLKRILDKAYKWFPSFKRFLNMEHECLQCGFSEVQTDKLLHGQNVNYSGWLHSNEYRQNALADNVSAQVIRDEKRNLFLNINQTPIAQWFREQLGVSQKEPHRKEFRI